MNGTLALIFALISLTDMTLNDCPSECLAKTPAQSRLVFQLGDVQFQEDSVATEIYLGRDFGMKYGPFQPTIGASITDNGETWVGAGAKWTSEDILSGPFFLEASLMPGLHHDGGGRDLGGALQFRTHLGAGFSFDNGATLTLGFDHRSNADTQAVNPGLEVISARYAIPF